MATQQTQYENPWYTLSGLDPKVYQTEAKAIQYRGFSIYQRIKGICFDVVKDGVCVAQHAGMDGAKARIDTILDNPTDFWSVRSLGYLKKVEGE